MDSAITLCEGALAARGRAHKRRCVQVADRLYAGAFRLMHQISLDSEQVAAFEFKSIRLESLMRELERATSVKTADSIKAREISLAHAPRGTSR